MKRFNIRLMNHAFETHRSVLHEMPKLDPFVSSVRTDRVDDTALVSRTCGGNGCAPVMDGVVRSNRFRRIRCSAGAMIAPSGCSLS